MTLTNQGTLNVCVREISDCLLPCTALMHIDSRNALGKRASDWKMPSKLLELRGICEFSV